MYTNQKTYFIANSFSYYQISFSTNRTFKVFAKNDALIGSNFLQKKILLMLMQYVTTIQT